MTQEFIRQQVEPAAVRERLIPIDHVLITATTMGTAQTIFTVPQGKAFILRSLMISNISGSNVTFSVHAVPAGGSAANDNALMAGVVIKANASDDLAPYLGKFYKAGYTIRVFASTTGVVAMDGFGREVF